MLHLSGGALESSKTELFLVQWKFNDNRIQYLSPPTDHQSISLTSPTSSRTHTIISKSPLESYKLLGFHLSPSLSMNKQYHVLHKKSHKLANAIAGSSITRSEAYTEYFALYLPAVSYVLVLSLLYSKQCHHIQSKPIKIFLQKCGYSSMMHRSIVFSPRSLGGLSFQDMYTTQGIQHVIKLIQTLQTPGQPNQLLRLLLAEWQINS